jgi:UDP-N-acetylglucosamine 2-epimerase (non-hydrolysing)
MSKKPVLVVIGTRPEAIKLSPVVERLNKSNNLRPVVVSTGQHGDLLDATLINLKLIPDHNLAIMKTNQSLAESASKVLAHLQAILEEESPCATIVQGDTTSALMGALASFYNKVPVCHVEAGLRTEDLFMPFPEEANRRLISVITSVHFTPTPAASKKLQNEGYASETIVETGNTGIDALLSMVKSVEDGSTVLPDSIRNLSNLMNLVLITCHRRETFGAPLLEVCESISSMAEARRDLNFVFPLHPNPNVKGVVEGELRGYENVHLIDALPYSQFVFLLSKARVIITDSGGIQEEAPSLGKRTIVLRNVTERSEAVENGFATMVGTSKEKIIKAVYEELNKADDNINLSSNIFGIGLASERIVNEIETKFGQYIE